MGGLLSRGSGRREHNPTTGPYALRNIQCTLEKHACFKCADGSIDLRYHPFLTPKGTVKEETVTPTWYQMGGIPLWLPMVILLIAISTGLSFLQTEKKVPAPFDSTVFNLTAMFIFSAYFFARLTFLYSRVTGAADGAYAAEDGAVSLSQHLSSLLTPDEIEAFPSLSTKMVRYDVQNCSTYVENVPMTQIYCETAYIAAALGYAMVFNFREVGVVAEKLPMHDVSRRELAYRVGRTNKDHLGVMLQMLEERIMAMVGAKLYKRPLRELTGQVDALNSIFANISKVDTLLPGGLLNAFLMFWLYVWLVFLVWVFPFGQLTNIILTLIVQIIAVGTLQFLEAEGLPFDNTETNPYSTIPIQNLKHTIAIAALGASLSVFDKIEAFGGSVTTSALVEPVQDSALVEPVQASASLTITHASSARRAPAGYNEYNIL